MTVRRLSCRYLVPPMIACVMAPWSDASLAQPLVLPPRDETAAKQATAPKPTIAALKSIADKEKSATAEMHLGEAYADRKDFSKAMACYNRAVLAPYEFRWCYNELVWDVEELVSRTPFDGDGHITLGHAFQKDGAVEQAELEYKQAIQLSPGHKNLEAQKLLAELAACQIKNTCRADDDAARSLFLEILNDQWHPPSHEGFALTRIYLYLYDSGRIKEIKVMVPSGYEDHDRLALDLVKHARFDIFRGRLGSTPVGRCDFACASGVGKRSVICVSWALAGC